MRENESHHEETSEQEQVSQEEVVPSRQRMRKQIVWHKRYRAFLWAAILGGVFCFFIGVMMKGYAALKNEMSKEAAVHQFEQALKKKDVRTLKNYIRSEEITVNEKTLAPLFTYVDQHPKAYEMLERDWERQWNEKHVYIKGLTSIPPIFTMKVYEKQFFLFHQYVFEPTLYSFVIRQEEEATVLVDGKAVQGQPTKEPFMKKYGPYFPGLYTVTITTKKETKTKKVVLFGGKRVHEIQF
ncbi:hypothetical protein AT864_01945 [Anoxybacillus sp. P3H1B]|uniref:TcaA second domain-containing protein n=1 Tax=Anoxybacillaceae TaxID=3120669 RepID=UPI00079865D5|nr:MULTISPECIES: hypothetical protein [Anoxybacillus]KXG09776.1 hypothetical protein AT864_01945 [Anoxybacillus sp. P3H1B]